MQKIKKLTNKEIVELRKLELRNKQREEERSRRFMEMLQEIDIKINIAELKMKALQKI